MKSILVVDDETIVLNSIVKILKTDDLKIETTTSAADAIERLTTENFDLLITDLMMPEFDGLALLKHLRERSIECQIIMITGFPTMKTALQAKKLGAFEYVTKPFTRQELKSVVVRALRSGDVTNHPITTDYDKKTSRNRYEIPGHSWLYVESETCVHMGILALFARSIGPVTTVRSPKIHDFVEQGRICLTLEAEDGVIHSVHSPISGRVVECNQKLNSNPELLGQDPEGSGWLLKIEPINLNIELDDLEQIMESGSHL